MLLDDVPMAIALASMFLAGAYIRAEQGTCPRVIAPVDPLPFPTGTGRCLIAIQVYFGNRRPL